MYSTRFYCTAYFFKVAKVRSSKFIVQGLELMIYVIVLYPKFPNPELRTLNLKLRTLNYEL